MSIKHVRIERGHEVDEKYKKVEFMICFWSYAHTAALFFCFSIFHHARVIFASESSLPQKSVISILCDSDIIWVSYALLKEHLNW